MRRFEALRPSRRHGATLRAVVPACIVLLVAVGCANRHGEAGFTPSTPPSQVSTPPGQASTTATATPTTSGASTPCPLVSTAQVTGLLQAGPLQVQGHEAGCQWFASDTKVNAFVAVECQSSAAVASMKFQSEEQFTPGQQPFAFADRAYSSFSPAGPGGFRVHATANVLRGAAIFVSNVNGVATTDGAVAVAKTIVEAAYRTFTSQYRCS